MIDRRVLMISAAGAALAAAAGQRALSQPDPLAGVSFGPPIVDIHCHIFNGADLPIYGFLRQAVFGIYDDQIPALTPGPGAPICEGDGDAPGFFERKMLEALASLLSTIMSESSISAQNEAQSLKALNTTNGFVPAFEAAGDDNKAVGDKLQQFFGSDFVAAAPGSDYLQPDQQAKVAALVEEGRKPLAEALLRELNYANPAEGRSAFKSQFQAASRASETTSNPGFISRNIAWAHRMTVSREKHARQISQMYGGAEGKVRLFTPALIDYSKWLKDEPRSDLRSQVEAMEQLAIYTARTGKVKFHGFVAYDPLRDVKSDGDALRLAQEAVRARGFLGVKLYPPMGFKPLGNKGDGMLRYPLHAIAKQPGEKYGSGSAAQLGADLDARLAGLYGWCAAEGVPILAHAADSNGAGPCFAKRADTANWAPVVGNAAHVGFKDIRVCLAHFGSFNAARDKDGKLSTDPRKWEQCWEWNFAKLMKDGRSKNVFADVSYFSELLDTGRTAEIAKLADALTRLIQAYGDLPMRLTYGSDWIMLDREVNKEQHLLDVHRFLAGVFRKFGDEQKVKQWLEAVFCRNSVRFLGLASGNPAHTSLTRFYQQHKLDAAWLNELGA